MALTKVQSGLVDRLDISNLPAGSVLKVQQFTDAGSTTTSGSYVNLNSTGFSYTPVSTNSTLYITCTAYAYTYPAVGYASGSCYVGYALGEYNGSAYAPFGNAAYLWSYQYSTTYGQSIAAPLCLQYSRANSSLTTRNFDLMGFVGNSNMSCTGATIVMTIIEVAN